MILAKSAVFNWDGTEMSKQTSPEMRMEVRLPLRQEEFLSESVCCHFLSAEWVELQITRYSVGNVRLYTHWSLAKQYTFVM